MVSFVSRRSVNDRSAPHVESPSFPEREALKPFILLAAALAATATTVLLAAETPTASTPPTLASQLPVMLPRVIAWAEKLAADGRTAGVPLTEAQVRIARGSGVRDPASIRVVVVDRIPLPDEPALKAAALQAGLSPASAAGMTIGYAVMVRRGYEDNVRLLSHEFRHVAQYEASGGIRPFLGIHLADLAAFGYEDSPFEVDARAHERDGPPVLRRASQTR
jgi:hypothetical protein